MGVYVGFLTYGGFFYYLNSLFILKCLAYDSTHASVSTPSSQKTAGCQATCSLWWKTYSNNTKRSLEFLKKILKKQQFLVLFYEKSL